MSQRQATRAEIAAATGLSKPTVSESVRRLSAGGSVVDTGRAHHRARPGRHLLRACPPPPGRALVASLAPEGIVAEAVDVYGAGRRALAGPGDPFARGRAGRADAATASPARSPSGPFRLAVVSAADPVDRETRAARRAARRAVPARRARRARRAGRAGRRPRHRRQRRQLGGPRRAQPRRATVRDFVYLFLGEGLGCAVVTDGEVRRGHAGLAGEIAHVVTVGPDGAAMRLTDVFAALGLRRPGSDRDRRAGAAAGRGDGYRGPGRRWRRAVAGVLSARGRADRSRGRAGRRPMGPASERAGGGGTRVRGRPAPRPGRGRRRDRRAGA